MRLVGELEVLAAASLAAEAGGDGTKDDVDLAMCATLRRDSLWKREMRIEHFRHHLGYSSAQIR